MRGFPTLWRLATEYFFLRKIAPRSPLLNGFYAGGFDHDEVREAEFVMGACMLVPFTLNGFAVREAFFVSFLGSLDVPAEQAFAAGFLFFLVTVILALPGGVVLVRDGVRRGSSPQAEHG